jgi:hypothetical protein
MEIKTMISDKVVIKYGYEYHLVLVERLSGYTVPCAFGYKGYALKFFKKIKND